MVKICNDIFDIDQEDVYKEHFSQFSFPLSDFQKYSIKSIVDGDHSLISVSTGSGKTLPGEFAIQHFVVRNY
jgi:superfamily II RNA helicase